MTGIPLTWWLIMRAIASRIGAPGTMLTTQCVMTSLAFMITSAFVEIGFR
jgi:hypothetical protein